MMSVQVIKTNRNNSNKLILNEPKKITPPMQAVKNVTTECLQMNTKKIRDIV